MTDMPVRPMPVHPLCDLFPLMEGEQFGRFVEDIRAHGIVQPVVVHQGVLVDGRNRLRACVELGLELPFVEWHETYLGEMTLVQWIWSTNVERRNLTPDQLAAAIVSRNNYERTRGARGRYIHHPDSGDGERSGLDPNHLTRSRLAKEAGVSQNRIEHARSVQLADPDLLKEVARGTITMHNALIKAKGMRAPEQRQQPPAEEKEPIWVDVSTAAEHEAKARMIRVLSQVRGLSRGFDTLNIQALRSACNAKEKKEWANIARVAARVLRGFALDLLEEREHEAHNEV